MTGYKYERLSLSWEADRNKSQLHQVYAAAADEGLWVKELGEGPNNRFLTGVGSVYTLQEIEQDNPEITIDINDFGLGDVMTMSMPGVGSTREASVENAIAAFKTSSLWADHQRKHKEAENDQPS